VERPISFGNVAAIFTEQEGHARSLWPPSEPNLAERLASVSCPPLGLIARLEETSAAGSVSGWENRLTGFFERRNSVLSCPLSDAILPDGSSGR
jgi:hypothetical protein